MYFTTEKTYGFPRSYIESFHCMFSSVTHHLVGIVKQMKFLTHAASVQASKTLQSDIRRDRGHSEGRDAA